MEKSATTAQSSAAKTGWLIVVLIVAVPVFIFWPKAPPPPPEPREVVQRAPSELTKVGLPDDPDLEGLPGFFAVWADYAEWKDNKTIFAYRHPVSGEFSLFFEATKTADGYRFRSVPAPVGSELDEVPDPSALFRFFKRLPEPGVASTLIPSRGQTVRPATTVPVDIENPKADAPKPRPTYPYE